MYFPETIDEFIRSEITEWGFDYVEAQFSLGFEPKCINGVWCWQPNEGITPVSASTSTVRDTPVNLIVTIN